ncbi:MAG: peptidase C1 [Proteobacteria bacterium]|nr:peptidase C1 [Pseudomonadota bacterium]
MLTQTQLGLVMQRAARAFVARCTQPLNAAMQAHGITTPARVCAFLAQIGHESGELLWMREIWGPTAQQRRYEPVTSLSKSLGNTQPGDGRRYMGRGPIQITGRANYARYGKLLGLDLEAQPQQAETPEVGFQIAALYWQRNGLNELADRVSDADDEAFTQITRRINGGTNGLPERRALWRRAVGVLGPLPAPAPVAASQAAASRASLARGAEAIAKATPATRRGAARPAAPARVLDARADTLDFRDQMYVPSLIEVPPYVPLGDYLAHDVPILDQGRQGACTGFGLATVVHYLQARRQVGEDRVPVSPLMLYDLARRYDEWPGEAYEGSSARGAMKGWHKHGVAQQALWPARARGRRSALPDSVLADARKRPLGAYFRVSHKDLVAMHAALAEVGILYATATTHSGWSAVAEDGLIPFETDVAGGHAFAIVAYDDMGFWIQNSWGPDWGLHGFARISYDDWLQNSTDVWVARLGVPVHLRAASSAAQTNAVRSADAQGYAIEDLRPHLISAGVGGALKPGGNWGTDEADLSQMVAQMQATISGWATPRVLLYAHGGLVSEQEAVQRLAEYRPALLAQQVYPLAFVWHSDFMSTLKGILRQAIRERRDDSAIDGLKDFLLDRVDDMLEPLARTLLGKLAWDDMKANARGASRPGHAAHRLLGHLGRVKAALPGLELHLAAHSAGSILLAPMLGVMRRQGLTAQSCTLWAPACTHDDLRTHYQPALENGTLARLALYLLTDTVEQDDDCAGIYGKSLLYLVSHALEAQVRIPGSTTHTGVPLLGMARYLDPRHKAFDPAFSALLRQLGVEVVLSPNDALLGARGAARALHHGDFDNDERTVAGTLARILGLAQLPDADEVERPISGRDEAHVGGAVLAFSQPVGSTRARRRHLDALSLPTAGAG